MKCKDIPDKPILQMLAKHPTQWHNWYFNNEFDVRRAMPAETPEKLVLAKIRMMIRRGVIDGCSCGCRGDFTITDKGLAELCGQHQKKPPQPSSYLLGTFVVIGQQLLNIPVTNHSLQIHGFGLSTTKLSNQVQHE